jgi:hypothetical protein
MIHVVEHGSESDFRFEKLSDELFLSLHQIAMSGLLTMGEIDHRNSHEFHIGDIMTRGDRVNFGYFPDDIPTSLSRRLLPSRLLNSRFPPVIGCITL